MKILLVMITLLFIGCDYKIHTQAALDDNGVTKIGHNVYIKGIKIKYAEYSYHTVYVYCDKDGTVTANSPITTNYMVGKNQQVTNTVIPKE